MLSFVSECVCVELPITINNQKQRVKVQQSLTMKMIVADINGRDVESIKPNNSWKNIWNGIFRKGKVREMASKSG